MSDRQTTVTVRDVRRRLIAHLRDAQRQLGSGIALDDDAIHAARKAIKRARGVLRLLRPAFGEEVFAIENARLRDAGRSLSGVRDAKVLADTLEYFRVRSDTSRQDCAQLLDAVTGAHEAAAEVESGGGPEAARAAVRESATSIGQRAAVWFSDEALARGFLKVQRRARRAYRVARRERTSEALHEWRKNVKNLWHALDALAPARPKKLGAELAAVAQLSELLGEEHDAALLAAFIAGVDVPAATRERLLEAIDGRRRRWQKLAFVLGDAVCGVAPRRAVRRVGLHVRRRTRTGTGAMAGRTVPAGATG